MAKSLVLAEKPSVGRELARVLGCKRGGEGYLEGDRYVVTWALGHLVTLADPDVYEKKWEKWDMADLPMLPQQMKLVVIPQTGRQFRVVQGLMKRGDLAELIIATDAGREGELVARWIMAKAGWRKPTKRLWISSQTDKAIKEGFARLRPAAEYDNLFRSAQARSEADWLVGLNVTRALTCRHNAQLSAGRVQTPTLALQKQQFAHVRSCACRKNRGCLPERRGRADAGAQNAPHDAAARGLRPDRIAARREQKIRLFRKGNAESHAGAL